MTVCCDVVNDMLAAAYVCLPEDQLWLGYEDLRLNRCLHGQLPLPDRKGKSIPEGHPPAKKVSTKASRNTGVQNLVQKRRSWPREFSASVSLCSTSSTSPCISICQ